MEIRFHKRDLPDLKNFEHSDSVAIDTETMGLNPARDRLCLIQISKGDDSADIVQIELGQTESPNLQKLLTDPQKLKIFHFARFDVAVLYNYLKSMPEPVWCTKIASRLVRTYTDRHSLKDLVEEILRKDLSKQMQSSNWGAPELSERQLNYAASDVLYLHELQKELLARLERENRRELAEKCFQFLPVRAKLDLLGWSTTDIFAH